MVIGGETAASTTTTNTPTNVVVNTSGGGGPLMSDNDKLRGPENYGTWKFAMRMALLREGLWPAVLGNEGDQHKIYRALSTICLNIQKSIPPYNKHLVFGVASTNGSFSEARQQTVRFRRRLNKRVKAFFDVLN